MRQAANGCIHRFEQELSGGGVLAGPIRRIVAAARNGVDPERACQNNDIALVVVRLCARCALWRAGVCLACHPESSISRRRVGCGLTTSSESRRNPEMIVSDDRPEIAFLACDLSTAKDFSMAGQIALVEDGPGSYRFTFSSARGELSGRVTVGIEGPPDRRFYQDREAAMNQILALSREFSEACGD